MSNARDKNGQALKAMFGSDALVDRLASTRIAVVLPSSGLTESGRLLATVLADVLARLWFNIDFTGEGAEPVLKVAVDAAMAGGNNGAGLQLKWTPPYDVTITVGCDAPPEAGSPLRVGANGWIVTIGQAATCGDDLNPVGPAFAAALAAAQVFHRVFVNELSGMDGKKIEEWNGDIRELFGVPGLSASELNLGETHVFGVGAVTHGLVWLLEHWSSPISGLLHLVDKDKYGESNGQRYAFMRASDVGELKVASVSARLTNAHSNLKVYPHPTDLNSYCAEHGYEVPLYRVIAGLDSEEARRQVALKLPMRTINMWTGGERAGAGIYVPGEGRACLACDYLESKHSPLDEVAELHQKTGLRPDIVRLLLDSGRGLSSSEADQVSSRWNLPSAPFIGEPLRSVLPTLCATGHVQMSQNSEAVDVPFAFASLFSGIAGFMMLMKDLTTKADISENWALHTFKVPTRLLLRPSHCRPECVRCTEAAHLDMGSTAGSGLNYVNA